MTDLPLLISTLEEGGEGSRELDARITVALDYRLGWAATQTDPLVLRKDGQVTVARNPIIVQPVSTSIDAALALIGERLPGARWRIEHLPPLRVLVAERPFWATCGLPGEQESACAATPALALCLALCRALQSQGETHDA